MQYQLVFRFRKNSLESPEDIRALERTLAEVLGETATMDGYDTGRRDVDLFMMTPDPKAAFRRSKLTLEGLALLDRVTVAYRLEGGSRFTAIWPLGYARKFSLS